MLSLSNLALELSEVPAPHLKTLALSGSQELSLEEFMWGLDQVLELVESRPERRWGVYLHDSFRFALVFFALLQAGKIPIVLPNAQPDFLAKLNSELDLLLLDPGQPALNTTALPCLEFPELDRKARTGRVYSPLNLERSRFVLFTSGSTGEPKKVEKKLAHIDCELKTLEAMWGRDTGDAVFLSTVSHQHIYGLLFRVLWPLCSGRTFDTQLYSHPSDLSERVRSCRRAVLVSSPAHLNRLPGLINLEAQGSRISAVFSSGGPLNREAALSLGQTLGRGVFEVLGSTETGGVAYRCQGKQQDSTLWQPFPGLDVKVETGGQRLRLKSPYIDGDSWYTMEDMARLTGDGRFELLGRADRVVKVEGKRVSLNEIETRLEMSELVELARALVLRESRSSIAAVLTLTPEGKEFVAFQSKAALKAVLKEELAKYFERVLLPRKLRILPEMPTNHLGKTTGEELEALFQDESLVKPIVLSVVQSENQVEMDLQVPEDLRYFQGHFPGHPVLPGVAQVDWAADYGMQYFRPQAPFSRLEAVKFHEFILPKAQVKLTLTYRPEQQKITFAFTGEQCKHSSGRIIFENQP